MPYNILRTNGTQLVVVQDGQTNSFSTSLDLIGKNVIEYGLLQNRNFVKLLENFANQSPPGAPMIGQLWFDTSTSSRSIKLYNGTSWRQLPKLSYQPTEPTDLSSGDLWWNSTNFVLSIKTENGYRVVGGENLDTAAVRLKTPRLINGVSFDGTQDITISAKTPYALQAGTYLSGSSFDGTQAVTWRVDASSSNNGNTIVARDGSGNFSASTITANLTGNVTGNVNGNAETVTNGVYTTGQYVNPNWLVSIDASKITGGGAAISSESASRLTASGRVSAETNTSATPAGLTLRYVRSNGYPSDFGNVISVAGEGDSQLLLGWSGITGSHADNYVRSRRDVNNVWSEWAKILTDRNINSYAPTLTGAGALGFWNISITGSAGSNVLKSGDSMTGPLTLSGSPTQLNHAVTKGYVDSLANWTITYGITQASGFTNSFSFNDSSNYFDVFPPVGKSMANLAGFIPSIAAIYFNGNVNVDDALRCIYQQLSDRIRVWVQNTEQRALPSASWLAIWR